MFLLLLRACVAVVNKTHNAGAAARIFVQSLHCHELQEAQKRMTGGALKGCVDICGIDRPIDHCHGRQVLQSCATLRTLQLSAMNPTLKTRRPICASQTFTDIATTLTAWHVPLNSRKLLLEV